MKKRIVWMLGLLCTVAQGLWAQTPTTVSSEDGLHTAVQADGANIQLTEDIQLSSYLNIEGTSVTIDLNGHKLSRNLSSSSDDGHIFWVHPNGNNDGGHLTIEDSSTDKKGSIEGGNATNGGGINVWPDCLLTVNDITFKNNHAGQSGGAIFVRENATANISNARFISNTAGDHGGAIWNSGTVTATNCTFTGNSAHDVGALYNAVQTEGNVTYAGSATLTGCTFTGNSSSTSAGALANAEGATVMTIDGCTIQNNTAVSNGGGIWNGGTLNIKGAVTVTGNTKGSGVASNVYLKSGTLITVTGSLAGSNIGVEMEGNTAGTFTSGYGYPTKNTEIPATFFAVNGSTDLNVWYDDNGDACLTTSKTAYYYDPTSTTGQQTKTANNVGAITRITTSIGSTGKTTWWLVSGTITNTNRIAVNGTVNLILEDGCRLTATKGLRVDEDNTLNIYAQSAGSGCGALIAQAEGHDASIGSNGGSDSNSDFPAFSGMEAGTISIYGGSVTAAIIGGGSGGNGFKGYGDCGNDGGNCQGISIYGGNVNAMQIGAGSGGRGTAFGDYDHNNYDGQNGSCENISLSWTNLTDRIHVANYLGTVMLQDQFLDNNDNTYAAGTYTNGIGNNDISINNKYLEAYVDKYNITIGGSFTPACLNASATKAPAGAAVTLTAINGYEVSDLTVKDADNQNVQLTDNNDGTWTFTMPASAVTVNPTTAIRYYALDYASDVTLINVIEGDKLIQGGTTYYKPGETYTFTVNAPNVIYQLKKVAIYYDNNTEHVIEPSGGTYSFEMPAAPVVISPVWEITACKINKQDNMVLTTAEGNVSTIDNVKYYKSGATITVSVNDIPAGRYLQNISVKTDNGYLDFTDNGNGTFTFTMPQEEVTLSVNYGISPNNGLTLLKGTNDFTVTQGVNHNGELYVIGDPVSSNYHCTYLFDGVINTHWVFDQWRTFKYYNKSVYVEFETNEPVIPKHYILTTTNDSYQRPGRNPRGWDVYAKENSSDTWTCIAHAQNNQTLEDKNSASYTFDFDNSGNNCYKYFRFVITDVEDQYYVQLAEMQMWVKDGLVLANDADNSAAINKHKNETTTVTLAGRTLWKDGDWNTLCLPFSLTAAQLADSPLAGATIKTLESSEFSEGTLILNFSADNLTAIDAGKPYLVKWAATTPDHIENPVFSNVTISKDIVPVPATTGYVKFIGTTSPFTFTANDRSMLYLGGGSTLYYPSTAMTVGSCRAYFQLNGIEAGDLVNGIRQFVLNFGDGEQTGIIEAEANSHLSSLNSQLSGWYTLDGRRLKGKPTAKGVYINNSKKVFIK